MKFYHQNFQELTENTYNLTKIFDLLLSRFVSDGVNIFWKICNVTEWKNYMSELTDRMLYSADNGECAAKEVMLFNEPNGYFAGSPERRVDRKDIKFRVGQVIKHRKFGYKGVIIGWDYRTKV